MSNVTYLMYTTNYIQKFQAVCATIDERRCTQALWPDVTMLSNVIGIALTTVSSGDIEILQCGTIYDPELNLIPLKPVYIGMGGYLTQDVPTEKVYRIGRALGQHTLYVTPSEFLLLNI